MENSIWQQLRRFVQIGFTEKFPTAFKGCCFGLIGSLNILWTGPFDSSVVVYVLKGLGTVAITSMTTLATLYISYRFENWKEKKSMPEKQKKRKNKAA
jgi:hypothetical protein